MSKEQPEDHELVAMTQQYTQDHDGKYVTHAAYEEINRQVAAGRPWAKCANCGNPYPLREDWNSGTVCSQKCADEYTEYLTTGAW